MDARIEKPGRIAFFGGSFDPPHLGHLAIARAARDALSLDRVLFAPVGAQPLKPAGSSAPFADRLAMTDLAIRDEAGFEISLIDAPASQGKPNYTLESLRKLRSMSGPNADLFCLMGADSFLGLRKWLGAAEIPLTAAMVVASRPGQRLNDLRTLLPEGLSFAADPCWGEAGSGGAQARDSLVECRVRDGSGRSLPFFVLPGLDVEISASAIREHLRETANPEMKPPVPAAVAAYIQQHGLYR